MKETLMDNMTKYFESEYNYTKAFLERNVKWAKPRECVYNAIECVYNAIQRCLGVAMYIQWFDETLTLDEVEQVYNYYKEQLEKLLD